MNSLKGLTIVINLLLLSLPLTSQGIIDSIQLYLQKREYVKVEEICRELTRDNEGNPEIWFYHGMALQGMQDYPGALESYLEASGEELFSVPSNYRMAECYESLGAAGQALELYKGLIERDSSDIYSKQQKGRLLMSLHNYEEAESVYRELLRKSPENYIFNKNIGICYYNLKQETRAVRYLVTAWLNNKRDLSLPVSIANAYAKPKMPDNALAWLKDIREDLFFRGELEK